MLHLPHALQCIKHTNTLLPMATMDITKAFPDAHAQRHDKVCGAFAAQSWCYICSKACHQTVGPAVYD